MSIRLSDLKKLSYEEQQRVLRALPEIEWLQASAPVAGVAVMKQDVRQRLLDLGYQESDLFVDDTGHVAVRGEAVIRVDDWEY